MVAQGSRKASHPLMQLAEARSAEALDLRLKGYSYADIAARMGLSNEGARRAVQRGMAEVRSDIAETGAEVREQESARLDRMLQTLERMAEGTEDPSTLLAIQDRMLRIQDRRARLLGLDMQRLEVTGAGGGPIQIAQIQRVIVDAPTTTITATVLDGHALPAPSEEPVVRDADASVVSRRETEDDNA